MDIVARCSLGPFDVDSKGETDNEARKDSSILLVIERSLGGNVAPSSKFICVAIP